VEDLVLDTDRESSPIRLVGPILAPILLIPAILLIREPENQLAFLSLAAGAASLLYAASADWLHARVKHPSRLMLANTGFYALMISFTLCSFIVLDHPRAHMHWVVFFLYFLLIGSAGLSDDPRQALAAGVSSIVGYCGVIGFTHVAAADGSAMAARLLPEFEWVANSTKIAMLGGSAVVAVASAKRGRELRRLSLRDGLTGLLNRHAFDNCLAHLAESATKGNTPLTIAMIDIDHFKRLNDEHGHATGDVVLRWVAARIERSFRATDLVARYGGEEFVVALLDTADACVIERLQVLRAHIATSVLSERRSASQEPDELELRTSVSIGIAQLPADGSTPHEVLARADARLYDAKAEGRNRIADGRPRHRLATERS